MVVIGHHRLVAGSACFLAFVSAFVNVGKSIVVQVHNVNSNAGSVEPPPSDGSHSNNRIGASKASSSSNSTATTHQSAGVPAAPQPAWQTTASPEYIQSIRDLNVLLFITTIFSDQHVDYMNCCWPTLMERSHLLPNVHVTVFGNNYTKQPPRQMEQIQSLFTPHNPSFQFRFATRLQVRRTAKGRKNTRLQLGANLGLDLGFRNGWFQPYEWIIRINPDVLIRQSDWLVRTMSNSSVDGIFVMCTPFKVHTDFFAVRTTSRWFNNNNSTKTESHPSSLPSPSTPFSVMVDNNHERTAYSYFLPILESGRYAILPLDNSSRGFCRVGARDPDTAPVYHGHDSCSGAAEPGRPLGRPLQQHPSASSLSPNNLRIAGNGTARSGAVDPLPSTAAPTCNALEEFDVN